MTQPSGFGKTKTTPPKVVTEATKKREMAAKEYDQMKDKGLPEYEIYVRIRNSKQWFPVGAIAVKRSSQVNQAIFANEESLLQGAFRIYPVLKRNKSNLEYGYRSKDIKDDPIKLAEQPVANIPNVLNALVSNARESLAEVFQKKKKKKP
ncbi:MAG: hypothetical protein HC860_18115 [Alkalinema sp. RU_4_3]|nr:hypothetical protein [Alkalinema sp. RU_4_3]